MADNQKPTVEIPSNTSPPNMLVVEDLAEGEGPEATNGQNVRVHYVGVAWSTGRQFDASWDRGAPLAFPLGAGRVIQGWDQGVTGMKVGGRRQLTIPPEKAYGPAGGGHRLSGKTLVFVIDLLGVK